MTQLGPEVDTRDNRNVDHKIDYHVAYGYATETRGYYTASQEYCPYKDDENVNEYGYNVKKRQFRGQSGTIITSNNINGVKKEKGNAS